jgi:drug/metabolite transporter (DMT)-like permease
MNKRDNFLIFFATLVAATFLMGSSFVAGKILIIAGFPALLLVAMRFVAASIFIFPYALWQNKWDIGAFFPKNLRLSEIMAIIAIGLCQTGGAMGFLFVAMKTISAPNGAILLFTNPLWVSLLGAIFLHEHLKPLRIFGLLIGVCGVFFAIGGNLSLFATGHGQIIGLMAAFSWAFATTINKKINPRINLWALSFWQMFIGAAVLLILALINHEKLPHSLSLENVFWFIWLAGPGSAVSFSLWFMALKKGGATNASSYLFLAPLFAVILAFLIMGVKLAPVQFLGGALICFAIWLINHNPQSKFSKTTIIEAQSEGMP